MSISASQIQRELVKIKSSEKLDDAAKERFASLLELTYANFDDATIRECIKEIREVS